MASEQINSCSFPSLKSRKIPFLCGGDKLEEYSATWTPPYNFTSKYNLWQIQSKDICGELSQKE